jgi:hypothetical protein
VENLHSNQTIKWSIGIVKLWVTANSITY